MPNGGVFLKKKYWIILGAILLPGSLLFLCLPKENTAAPYDSMLPSISRDQTPSDLSNISGTAEGQASVPQDHNRISSETADPAQTGSVVSEPEMPIDWNREPTETGTKPELPPDPSTLSRTPDSSEKAGNSNDDANAVQTEPEETKSPSETGGHVIIPILPPDLFP